MSALNDFVGPLAPPDPEYFLRARLCHRDRHDRLPWRTPTVEEAGDLHHLVMQKKKLCDPSW